MGLAGGPSTFDTSLTHSRKRRRTSSGSRHASESVHPARRLPWRSSVRRSTPARLAIRVPTGLRTLAQRPEVHRPTEKLLGTALERHLAPPVSAEGDGRNADLARELADRERSGGEEGEASSDRLQTRSTTVTIGSFAWFVRSTDSGTGYVDGQPEFWEEGTAPAPVAFVGDARTAAVAFAQTTRYHRTRHTTPTCSGGSSGPCPSPGSGGCTCPIGSRLGTAQICPGCDGKQSWGRRCSRRSRLC